MDGGGFNAGQRQNQTRNKGMSSISCDVFHRSSGNNSNSKIDFNGVEHSLGATVEIIGNLTGYEVFEGYILCSLQDGTSDRDVKAIVQPTQIPSFNETLAETYKNHLIQIIGMPTDHPEYGRAFNALAIKEVVHPMQWVAHLMDCALLTKSWRESTGTNGGKENVDPFAAKAPPKRDGDINKQVEDVIKQLGEGETWGVKRDKLYQQLPSHGKPKVDAAIQYLIDEGLVYNTLDDDTFKSSDQ